MIEKTKLTQDNIDSVIAAEDSLRAGKKTTVVILTLVNGFEVIGTAACVTPEDYNHEIGVGIARKRAIDKVWELEGYLLQARNFSFGETGA